MKIENAHWCVGGDSESVDLPRLVQSILNRAGILKLDLTHFAQNVTYLVFHAHERIIGGPMLTLYCVPL